MDLQGYFARIGYTEGGTDTERLQKVHRGHITHIPFENLDVFNGKNLSVKPEDVYEKMVTNRRGGYCFEMNSLLCWALNEMGIPTYGVLARVSRGGQGFGNHSHRMNISEADGRRWICDVGFGGDCFVDPLLFELETEQETHGCVYRVMPGKQVQYVVQLKKDGVFTDLLGFDDIPALAEDFELSNFYTNCHPTSGFKHMLMLNRFTETGRVSMFNTFLTLTEGSEVTRRDVPWEELSAVLQEHFGLDVMPDHQPEKFSF